MWGWSSQCLPSPYHSPLLSHSLLRLTLMLLKRGVSFPMGKFFPQFLTAGSQSQKSSPPCPFPLPPSPPAHSPLIPAPFLPACSQDTSVAKLKLYKLRHKLLLFCVNRDKFSQPWEIKTRAGSTSLDLQPHKTSQMSYIGGKNIKTPASCCPELL